MRIVLSHLINDTILSIFEFDNFIVLHAERFHGYPPAVQTFHYTGKIQFREHLSFRFIDEGPCSAHFTAVQYEYCARTVYFVLYEFSIEPRGMISLWTSC